MLPPALTVVSTCGEIATEGSQGLDLWIGTWSIASGTGRYAGAHGVGAYLGIIGPNHRVALHFGFRT